MKAQLKAQLNEQLLATLENSRNYTVSVAEAMPGDAYDFKPKGMGWNFRELLSHMAYSGGNIII